MDDGLGFMVGVSACMCGVKGEGEVHECDMHAEYTTPVYIHVVGLAICMWTSMPVHMSCMQLHINYQGSTHNHPLCVIFFCLSFPC